MNKINTLFFTGLPISLPLSLVLAYAYSRLILTLRGLGGRYARLEDMDYKAMFLLTVCVVVLFFGVNVKRKLVDKEDTFIPFFRVSVMEKSPDQKKAQKHPVPPQYLTSTPEGFTLGRSGRKYVSLPFLASPEHMLLLGSPGSRKSSIIILVLLWIYNFAYEVETYKTPLSQLQETIFHSRRSEIPRAVLAVDPKPELTAKSVGENSSDIRIINPSSKDSWGFDVWFGLDQNSTDDEIKERADDIAHALIPTMSGDNVHFSGNAQKILSGFLMYGFRKGYSFTDSIIKVMDASVSNLIAEIVSDPEMEQHSKILHKVKGFDIDSGSESDEFASIKHTLEKDLDIFDVDTVQYCFSDNSNKVTPADLRDGISVFLAIPDDRLTQYKTVFGMIIELSLKYLMSTPEENLPDGGPVWCLIDEGGTIYVPSLLDVASRGRSKKIMLTVVAQSYSQLEGLYGGRQARSILECCKSTVVLSCNDTRTARDLSAWTGSYRETKVARHARAYSLSPVETSRNVSEEYRPVMDVSDIKQLEKNNEALVFAKGDWFLVEKVTYKDIPKYSDLSDEIYEENVRRRNPNPPKNTEGSSRALRYFQEQTKADNSHTNR